jgi:hypothetical protein
VNNQWEVTKVFLVISVIGLAIRSKGIFETGICGTALFAFTALMMQQKSIDVVTNLSGEVSIAGANMAYVKVMLVGSLMLFSLKYNPKGLLPEVPNRPNYPSGNAVTQAESGGDAL